MCSVLTSGGLLKLTHLLYRRDYRPAPGTVTPRTGDFSGTARGRDAWRRDVECGECVPADRREDQAMDWRTRQFSLIFMTVIALVGCSARSSPAGEAPPSQDAAQPAQLKRITVSSTFEVDLFHPDSATRLP